jgi:hypothetical protein
MSEQDEVRPYHAKGVASGQETADTLAAVLKHAAARDEAAKKKSKRRRQPKWMLPLGVNLGVLAVYLLIAPPAWVVLNDIEPPPPAVQVANLQRAIVFQAGRINSYQAINGRLPESLEEAGSPTPGVQYHVRGASSYQLVGSVGDQIVLYDSTESLEDWAADLDLLSKIQG